MEAIKGSMENNVHVYQIISESMESVGNVMQDQLMIMIERIVFVILVSLEIETFVSNAM